METGSSSTRSGLPPPRLSCPAEQETPLTPCVLCWQNRTQVTSDVVTRDKEMQSRYGHFKHNLMVGKPWGIKVSFSLSLSLSLRPL